MKKKTRKLTQQLAELATCNPFSPRRFEIEKQILGPEGESLDAVAWNRDLKEGRVGEADRPNVILLMRLAGQVVDEVSKSGVVPAELKSDYWSVATYFLLYRHITPMPYGAALLKEKSSKKKLAACWGDFKKDFQKVFDVDCQYDISEKAAAHLFACLFQVHRAFFNIFNHLLGSSLSIARLRQQVWESVFTCCIYRYHNSMFERMRDVATLVTGPSGTGKELVARAIGLSQYVPFDPDKIGFETDGSNLFLPLNLSALSSTLIESELFGHRKGAFTGAVEDRQGWLETCSPYGTVFLDEIGELDLGMQVKLLRMLQQRTYSRLGESEERNFAGKLISATNRNLEKEISEGNFRHDFYFRICTDQIVTPSLRAQLDERPADLLWLVESILARRLSSGSAELAEEIVDWINKNLGESYAWHGNIRELEQCVSSYLIRQSYVPIELGSDCKNVQLPDWLCPAVAGELTAEQLLSRYCTYLYSIHSSYEKTAQILKLDRRTVKSKIDTELLSKIRKDQ